MLTNPGSRPVDAVRSATLFTYSGLASNDSSVFDFAAKAVAAGKDPKVEAKKEGFKPDLKKRGTVRSAFDGRYRFSRYCAPIDRNSPKTIDELYKWNDVELYDLQSDPKEMKNLAADCPKIREVRGLGLMCGVEFVQDKKTKAEFPASEQIGPKIHLATQERGMYTRLRGDVYLLAPPMITEYETLDEMVAILKDSVKAVLG